MRPGEGKRKGENVAVAQCPASCGELIQGWILGSEKLVSCPVDWYSTLFRQLTLFDHNTAATQIACPPPPALDLLVLESPLTLRTTDYHQLPREPGLLANASRLQLAWEKVQQACHCGSPQLLGEAATISAIASQQLLPKPGFDALLDLVESAGLYGLNVAHSGSVVGLLLDRRRHDVEFLQWRLADSDIAAHWPQQHLLAMVPGGVILQ